MPSKSKYVGVRVTGDELGLNKANAVPTIVVVPSSGTCESTGKVKLVYTGESWTPASVLKFILLSYSVKRAAAPIGTFDAIMTDPALSAVPFVFRNLDPPAAIVYGAAVVVASVIVRVSEEPSPEYGAMLTFAAELDKLKSIKVVLYGVPSAADPPSTKRAK
jgi:hypothetical protein